jgi:hypothetical protein
MLNEPVSVSVWLSGLTDDAVAANDADTAFRTYEAVCAVPTKDAVCAKTTYDAVCAVVTNDAVCASVTNDAVVALFAHDAVPNNDPVIPPLTLNDPVIVVVNPELTCSIGVDPVHTVNSEPETTSSTENNTPVDPLIVTTFEPDLYVLSEPVNTNVWFNGFTYDAVDANDDDTADDAVSAYEAETACSTYDAVCAVATYDAVCAFATYEAV